MWAALRRSSGSDDSEYQAAWGVSIVTKGGGSAFLVAQNIYEHETSVSAFALAATFGYGPYYLYANSGFARYLQLRRDLAAVEVRNARLRAETERLAREAEALRTNSRAVENVARADLGWVRPGEVVFDLGHGP